MRTRVISLLAAGCTALWAGATAHAAEYVYGSWVGPNNAVLEIGRAHV